MTRRPGWWHSRPIAGMEKSLRQPGTNREVIDLDTGIRDGYGGDEDAYGDPDMGTERGVGMPGSPVHLHIYHGIVGDIQRVGNHVEKLAHGCSLPPGQGTSGPYRNNGRIDNQYHHRAIESIEPLVFHTSDMWHHQCSGNGNRAPQHTAMTQVDAAFAKPVQEQTAEEHHNIPP